MFAMFAEPYKPPKPPPPPPGLKEADLPKRKFPPRPAPMPPLSEVARLEDDGRIQKLAPFKSIDAGGRESWHELFGGEGKAATFFWRGR